MHRLRIKLLAFSSFSNSSLYGQSFVLTQLHLTHFKDCLFSLTSSGSLCTPCCFLHFCTVSLKISVGPKILSSECPNGPQRASGGEISVLCFFRLLLSVEEGGGFKEKREPKAISGKKNEAIDGSKGKQKNM